MKEKFPFKAPELVVTKDMCDINGHMNVAYYLKIFDEYSRPIFEEIGFNSQSSFSIFALEDSLRYLKEFLLGDTVFPRFRIVNVNSKLIHIVGVLINKNGELSSISETIVAHVDMDSRRTLDMPDEFYCKVKTIKEAHDRTGAINFDLRLKIKSA
jgi:acyl-CoA thioester hydrolase|tara:strand:+ start:59 stop:523 length:465 start_codon:yes stop_codon:yes gene_type:complete